MYLNTQDLNAEVVNRNTLTIDESNVKRYFRDSGYISAIPQIKICSLRLYESKNLWESSYPFHCLCS